MLETNRNRPAPCPPAGPKQILGHYLFPRWSVGRPVAGPASAPAFWIKTPAQGPLHCLDSASWAQTPMAAFLPAREASGRLRGSQL